MLFPNKKKSYDILILLIVQFLNLADTRWYTYVSSGTDRISS